MTKPFQPKTREEIKQEVITKHGIDYDANKELVDGLVEDFYKEEEFKAAEKNKTASTREALKKMTQAKEFYKKGDKPKGEQQPNGDYVTKDDLKDFGQRQRYSHFTDEEYNSINALAKANKVTIEETLEKNPIAANYVKNINISQRLAGATKAPGTRFEPGEQKTEEDKIADEMSDGLPVGYSLPKSN